MKWRVFILILTILFSGLIKAEDLNFSYTYKENENHFFNLEAYELSKKFENKNFIKLSAFPSGNLPIVNVDEVLTSKDHGGIIYIKTGLIAPPEFRYKVITAQSFFLFHTDTASIAFFNFNISLVNELVDALKPIRTVHSLFSNLIISDAYGDDGTCSLPVRNKAKGFDQIEKALSDSLLVKRIGECTVNALKGGKNQVKSTTDFFNKLATDPKKLWTEVNESYKQLKNFISNFTNELQSFYKTLTSLSTEEKLDIACTMSGEMAASLAIGVTGAGLLAASSRISLTILPKLERFKRLLEQFKNYGIPYQAARESLNCAI